jgi:GT2 family glycosyltransferase
LTDEEAVENAVAVAYVHTDEVFYSWHHSMTQLLAYDASNEGRIWHGGYVAIRGGTDGLAHARNTAVTEFLADSTAEWLWWIDTDMGFAADTVEQLLAAADPVERPIVGALCFANRETENDGMGGRRSVVTPVVLDWKTIDGESGYDVRWDYPRDTVTRVDGVGMACVLIHRSVLERIQAEFGPNWYSRARNPSTNSLISEDLSFCVRANALSIPIHVHTGVKTTHAKRAWLGEEDYWRQRALTPPPPAEPANGERTWTVPRYAIIPTHNRPEQLLVLAGQIGAQCDVIVIVDNASTPPVDQAALLDVVPAQVAVEVIRDEEQPPNLARFWNLMFDRCEQLAGDAPEWDIAVLNDDAVVPAGWYDACANGLRANPDAIIAHTNPTSPALLKRLFHNPANRMCPHAFVIGGAARLRADESMRWWYQDTDLDFQARQAGGVLSVPGPRVINANANSTTVGELAEQAQKDRAAFEAKWSR